MAATTLTGALYAANVPTSDVEKYSYAIGYDIGKKIGYQFDKEEIAIDTAMLVQAIEDTLNDKKQKMSLEEMNAAMQALNEAKQKHLDSQAETNLKESRKFLAANKTKPGVVTTQSGLQYKVLTTGDGAKPTQNDKVTVHYHGTLLDGTVFDSSVDRKEPASFGITQVIAGWQEALQLMNEGSKWQVVIPPELAYGNRKVGAKIGPNSALVFEIELLEILK